VTRQRTAIDEPGRGARMLAVLGLVGFLSAIALPSLSKPFLTPTGHIDWGNGSLLWRTTQSLDARVTDMRRFFGVTHIEYGPGNSIQGVSHYAHHGVLGPMLARACVAALGSKEWVARLFALAISSTAALLCLTLLWQTTNVWSLSFLLTVTLVLLPLRIAYVTTWKYEALTEVVLLGLMVLATRQSATHSAAFNVLLAVLGFVAFHTDWPAWLVAPAILGFICWHARRQEERTAAKALAIGEGLGILSAVAVLLWLGFRNPVDVAVERMAGGPAIGRSRLEVLMRQLLYADLNFTTAFVWAGIVATLFVLWTTVSGGHSKPPSVPRPLRWFGLSFLLMNLSWCVVFQGHALVHAFAQWYFATGFCLLIADALANESRQGRRLSPPLGIAAFTALWLCLAWANAAQYLGHSPTCSAADIEAIRTINGRLAAFTDLRSGPPLFWRSACMQLYTNPTYRKSDHAGLVLIEDDAEWSRSADYMVIWRSPEGLAWLKQSGEPLGLAIARTSPSFLFLTPQQRP